MGALTVLVPLPYRLLAITFLAVALLGFGWVKGAGHVQGEWDAATSKQTLQVAGVKVRQAEASVKVVTEYVDRVQTIRVAGEKIIKEVPIYVPKESDAGCTVPAGLVRLRNDAAAGRVVRNSAGTTDAGASESRPDPGRSIGAK